MMQHLDPYYNTTKIRYADRGAVERTGYHSFKVMSHVQYLGNSNEFPIIPSSYSPINHTVVIDKGFILDTDETLFNLLLRGNVGFPICRFYR